MPAFTRLHECNLPINTRHAPTLESFKYTLRKSYRESNILYYYGQRWPAIHHARLRIGCSKLKYDLCFNLHVIDDPSCSCGAHIEDAEHFFLFCPNYNDIRVNSYTSFPDMNYFDISTILYGNHDLPVEANKAVFEAVHKFMIDSKRFD